MILENFIGVSISSQFLVDIYIYINMLLINLITTGMTMEEYNELDFYNYI